MSKYQVVHFGLGRFHRAHQAVYFQKLKDEGFDCSITAFSMRSRDAADELKNVGFRYPVVQTSAAGFETTWIDVIEDSGFAVADLEKSDALARDPQVQLVTLTVTEKGYCLDNAGKLDFLNSAIQADLLKPDQPQTAIGILVRFLKTRAATDHPITIVSCDNLRANSDKLKEACFSFIRATSDSETLQYLNTSVSFANSMVDRIVPSLSPERLNEIQSLASVESPELVATETFSQWVVEDRFKTERPPLETVGVEFVEHVEPFEEMKLRLLNAAHSNIAYSGLLHGHAFVHEAIRDDHIRGEIKELFAEVIPLLDRSPDELVEYTNKLLARFENSKLPHSLEQIAMDGSQKLPQRIFPSLEASRKHKTPHDAIARVLATWTKFLHARIQGNVKIQDPAAPALTEHGKTDLKQFATNWMSDTRFFPESLRQLQTEVLKAL